MIQESFKVEIKEDEKIGIKNIDIDLILVVNIINMEVIVIKMNG